MFESSIKGDRSLVLISAALQNVGEMRRADNRFRMLTEAIAYSDDCDRVT